jgi:selenocysteine-specific elongation factor
VVAGEALKPTFRVDVALSWITPDARPDGGTRVAVHHGTRETAARLAELGGRYFQLRLEQPLVPARGDRLVIRSLAPPDTLGGGVVLDPDPPRHGPSRDLLVRLARLERGEADPPPEQPPAPETRRRAEPEPLSPAALELEQRLKSAGLEPPPDEDPAPLAALREHGRIVRLGRDMHLHRDALDDLIRRVTELIQRDGEVTIATLRDELHTSRRYAQALLELLDAERVTLRVGDARVLRKKSS